MNELTGIKITRGLFLLNALVWLALGAHALAGMAERYPGRIMAYAAGVMMLGNAGAMALSGVLLGRLNKGYFYFAIFILIINILLTITDQTGFFDFATLAIDLVLISVLISVRRRYLSTI